MFNGPMISLAYIAEEKNARGTSCGIRRFAPPQRSSDGEPHRVAKALLWRPVTSAGISQIAKCFQNLLRWKFAGVPGRRAVATPSCCQGKPAMMWPVAIL